MSIIIEKAHELGQAISASDEAVVLHAAELNLEQDQEAQALIGDFQARHKKIQEAEEANQEASDEEWNEFNLIQDKMKSSKPIQAYFAAMQNFQKLLQDANTEINKILQGAGSCSPSACDSCSLDCSQ